MQMKNDALLALAAFSLAAVGCGERKGPDGSSSDNSPGDRIFDEKSGRIEMKASMMGMNPTITLYFDDWGKKTATMMEMTMPGRKKTQHSVTLGDTTIQWDRETMAGTRAASGAGNMGMLTSYTNMDAARKKSLNYKEIGEKEVLGKTAKGFSIDTAGSTMKIWRWKNIPVYMEVASHGMSLTMEATRIDVPGDVPADMFTIPTSVNFNAPTGGIPPGGDSGKGGSGAVETDGPDTTKKIR